jgi:hypothetical protein
MSGFFVSVGMVGRLGQSSPARTPFTVDLPGSNGDFVSTPDSAALDPSGNLDIRMLLAMDDWTPGAVQVVINKAANAGDQFGFDVYVNTSGTLVFRSSTDGSNATLETKTSTVAPSVGDGDYLWIRVVKDITSGDVDFYTAPPQQGEPATWTALGATVTGQTGAIYDSGLPLVVGAFAGGTAPMAGAVRRALVYWNDVRVADLNADRYSGAGATVTGVTGETWTLQGNATITS